MMAILQAELIRVIIRRFSRRKTVICGYVFDAPAFGITSTQTNGVLAQSLPLLRHWALYSRQPCRELRQQTGNDALDELQGVLGLPYLYVPILQRSDRDIKMLISHLQ